MIMTRRNRWSDNDYNFGPFTYARDMRGWNPFAIVLRSGNDEYRDAYLRFSGFGHTFITSVPSFLIKPYKERVIARTWDSATIERLGRDWYEEVWPREYGFNYHDGFLQIFLGIQTHSSNTTQSWSCFIPWTKWRCVRRSYYDNNGEIFWTSPEILLNEWELILAKRDQCPTHIFSFIDFDGEKLTAKTKIEEAEYKLGTGYFKWVSIFTKPKIYRSLSIDFSDETGRRKGSWKGGTIGTSINMLPGELHEEAFRRYCLKNDMTFVGVA